MPELTTEYISNYYHLPISEAAEEMNICETILKRFCRTNGISRWPHRKIRSLDNIIEQLHIKLKDLENTSNPSNMKDSDRIKKEIEEYEKKKQLVFANPNISFASIVTKSTLQSFSKAKLKNIKNRAYYGEKIEKVKSEGKSVTAKMISTTFIHPPKISDNSNSLDQSHLHIPHRSPPHNTDHLDQMIGNHNNNNNNNNNNNDDNNNNVNNENNVNNNDNVREEIASSIKTDTPFFTFPSTFILFDDKNNNNDDNANRHNNHANKKRKFDDYQKEDTNGTNEFTKFKSSLPAVKYQRIWGPDNSLPLYYSILI